LQAREQSTSESSDVKVKGLLQKVKLLEDELQSARGTNQFLKKQLETSSQVLRVSQDDHARQLQSLQSTLISQNQQAMSRSMKLSRTADDLTTAMNQHQQQAQDIQRRSRELTEEKNELDVV
jgi:chromosome segregation ATPase